MEVAWSESALRDLEHIRDYIALDQPVYATIFIERLLHTTRHLTQFPLSGRLMPEAQRADIREVLY